MKVNREVFNSSIIAQADSGGYDPSGYIACVFPDGTAGIFNFSHCSCYGTWEALSGNDDYEPNPPDRDVTPVWEGGIRDLCSLASSGRDPAMPEREMNKSDYDYDHLVVVYEEILQWAAGQGLMDDV